MSGSGAKINYNVRPSKSVERKMLLDVVKELFKHYPAESCRYIGFGSFYFTDFKLAHKELHIDKMISFESETTQLARVEFNKPYKCIEIIPGTSTTELPGIDWSLNMHDFIWLDYDDKPNSDMLNDCETVFANISPGSVFVMTATRTLSFCKTIEDLRKVFGEYVPNNAQKEDLVGKDWRDVKMIRQILVNKINKTLDDINIILPAEDKLIFYPLFLFCYKDGAPMMSFGGYIDKASKNFTASAIGNQQQIFLSQITDNPFEIVAPNLTYKEIYHISQHLPSGSVLTSADLSFIPAGDIENYRLLYKYLPTYMDVIQ